jgi:hypothetical protein
MTIQSKVRLRLGIVLLILGLCVLLFAISCGPKRVKLTIPELRDLEACVINANDDQVARQNCVERLIPVE